MSDYRSVPLKKVATLKVAAPPKWRLSPWTFLFACLFLSWAVSFLLAIFFESQVAASMLICSSMFLAWFLAVESHHREANDDRLPRRDAR